MDDGNTCSSSSEGESSSYNCDNAETGKVRSNILSLPVLNQILSKSKYSGWYIYISYQEENKVVSGWVRIRLCLTKVILNIVGLSNLQDAHIIPVYSRWLCLPFVFLLSTVERGSDHLSFGFLDWMLSDSSVFFAPSQCHDTHYVILRK